MIEVIKKFPEMIKEATEIAKHSDLPTFDFNNIVVCGAGGSAIVGSLLKDLLKYDYEKPIEIFTDYKLPKFANEKTLVIFISYSGNTEETLSQFSEALKRKCKIIAVTSGGKLEEWSTRFNLPLIKVPKGYQPRYAVLSMLIPLVLYMEKIGVKEFKKDIAESIESIKKINLGHLDEIANKIEDKEIAIYGTNDYAGVVRRFKNDFNENAKILVLYDAFPELDHTEIVGFENYELNKNRAVLILRDKDESQEMKSRIEITKKIIMGNVHSIDEIWTVGKSRLAKIVSLIYMSGYLSCKLAELNLVNPKKTEFMDRLKKDLKNKLNLVEKLEKQLK